MSSPTKPKAIRRSTGSNTSKSNAKSPKPKPATSTRVTPKSSSASRPGNQKSKSSGKQSMLFVEDKFPGLSLKSKPKRPQRTGFMYDEKMLANKSLHDDNYLDSPTRISSCYDKCKASGLVKRCIRLKVVPATDKDLLAVHDKEYVEKVKASSSLSREELISMEHGFHNISFHPSTMECARLAAGAAIEMMKAIVADQVGNGITITRPPGHHATREEGSGLCYFNNVAIATLHCLNQLHLDRVLIVDWDVHHGNGTQQLFYSDPRVLYISIHRYEHGWFWPNLRESDFDHIGEGEGLGYNVNIPLNKTGMTDADYLAIFHQLIMPLALAFDPSAIIVSAGFDCALGCPEGEMEVIPPLFGHLVHMLKSVGDGRLAVILEGGYHMESLSESVVYSVKALLGDCCSKISTFQPPKPELVSAILNCINVLRPHWQCFPFQTKDEPGKAVDLKTSDPRGTAPFVSSSPAYHELNTEVPQPEEIKAAFTKRIQEIVAKHSTRTTKSSSCYVYDEYMMKHKNALDPTHPECPQRISRIHEMCEDYGLLVRCLKLPSRKATKSELALVHNEAHIGAMKALETTKPRDLAALEEKYNSIYLHPDTYGASLMAAGSLLNIVDSVMTDQSRNGFAITRPPGHHAEEGKAYGFCFFNNVPIAAKYAQNKYNAKRIAIIDWDVHHGNGTQHMFESDDSVLYISLHRYDNGWFFPGSTDANYDQVGKGRGLGYNVNVAFSDKNFRGRRCRPPGDPEYIAAFQQLVMPICYEFAPDLVFISAGFDAAKGDPLGGYNITPGGYAHMTHMLSALADGRLILVLEGGYNLNSISEGFSSCVDVMLGGTPPRIPNSIPDPSAVSAIKDTIRVHKKYWKSLCCDVVLPYSSGELEETAENDEEEDTGVPINQLADLLKEVLSMGNTQTTTAADNVAAESEATSAEVVPGESMAGAGEASGKTGATSNSQATEMYEVVPLKWCAHLEDNSPLDGELDTCAACEDCGNVGENWVCLTCYKVYCSRYVNEHMLFHSIASNHKMVLSYADLSVWCYACDSYVHNEALIPMKNSAHKHKFGVAIPGSEAES